MPPALRLPVAAVRRRLTPRASEATAHRKGSHRKRLCTLRLLRRSALARTPHRPEPFVLPDATDRVRAPLSTSPPTRRIVAGSKEHHHFFPQSVPVASRPAD